MQQPVFTLDRTQPEALLVRLGGSWHLHADPPGPEGLLTALAPGVRQLRFAADELEAWDTRLLIFLRPVLAAARQQGIEVRLDGLPAGVQRLLTLAAAVPEHAAASAPERLSLVERTGRRTLRLFEESRAVRTFTGEIIHQLLRLLTGRAPFRGRDFFAFVQTCGAESLPIVSLIAALVGVILSFVGAVQLQMFGAQIYVANLVGLGMVLEMGALMSGVIVAGRIGASYAAQLGTMQVNEEIDALRTMGISPV